MKRAKLDLKYNEHYIADKECETITEKVARITENNEPISDGVQMIYTPRKDGVMKQFNIRTDKWDIAQEAMERVATAKRGTIQKKLKGTEAPEKQEKQEKQEEPEQPKQE